MVFKSDTLAYGSQGLVLIPILFRNYNIISFPNDKFLSIAELALKSGLPFEAIYNLTRMQSWTIPFAISSYQHLLNLARTPEEAKLAATPLFDSMSEQYKNEFDVWYVRAAKNNDYLKKARYTAADVNRFESQVWRLNSIMALRRIALTNASSMVDREAVMRSSVGNPSQDFIAGLNQFRFEFLKAPDAKSKMCIRVYQ